MTLKKLSYALAASGDVPLFIMLPTGETVPKHYHVTEVGRVHKTFVDCGGIRRESVTCLLQAWTADDFDHRITTSKLSKILKLAEPVLGPDDMAVEFEYGADNASQYKLADVVANADGVTLVLDGKRTDCLAPDKCGVGQCGNDACC